MIDPETWQKIEKELAWGEKARAAGMEGRARVCARRAAGQVVRAYLAQQGSTSKAIGPGNNVIDLLRALEALEGVPDDVKQSAENLLVRVNEDYELPVDVDLLEEVRKLMRALLA